MDASEETVALEAFDDPTKIQGVYFVVMGLLNQESHSDIITIKMLDESEEPNTTIYAILACLLFVIVVCACFYKMHKKQSKITTNKYSVLTTKDNLEEGVDLLQGMKLKF